MACVNVRDVGLLLQNLVTYEAVTNVEIVMIYFYMPNYCQICSRKTLSYDLLCMIFLFCFLVCRPYCHSQPEMVLYYFFAPWSRFMLLFPPANWHSVAHQCLEIEPNLDPLIYISSNPKMFLSHILP